ncbi:MAG: LamG-like jellyroll fold domain-containing protein, partial [Planctomycetaceae bacterium]
QADNNDSYIVQVRDPVTGTWSDWWQVPNYASKGIAGVIQRPDTGFTETADTVALPQVVADRLRVFASGGDNYYSVSELRVFGTPVESSSPDVYAFTAAAGQRVSVALASTAGATLSAARLEILDAAGQVVAASLAASAIDGRIVSGFVAPADGTYSVRVSRVIGEYAIDVVRGATLRLDGHRSVAPPVGPGEIVSGFLGGGTPRLLATQDLLTSWGVALSVDGRYAYVTDLTLGLVVFDVSTPSSPRRVGGYDTPGSCYGVTLSPDGRFAYLSDWTACLQIVDVSVPSAPRRVGSFDTTGGSVRSAVSPDGAYVFVADATSGLQVIDVRSPSAPVLVGAVDTPGNAYGVTLSGDARYAYVADYTQGIQVVDVSDRAAPRIVGSYQTPGHAWQTRLSSDGKRLFVACNDKGLVVLDVTTPAAPVLLGTYDTSGVSYGLTLSPDGTLAFVADYASGLQVVDISNPGAPSVVAAFDTTGSAIDVALSADGDIAFVADRASGLQVLDVARRTRALHAVKANAGDTLALTASAAFGAGATVELVGPAGDVVAKSSRPTLVGLYQFDDPSNLGRDTSGRGNDASSQGAAFTLAGYQDGALSLDGTSYLRAPIDVRPSTLPRMTWGAWVRPSAANPIRAVLSADDGGFDRNIGIDFRGGGENWSAFTGTGVLGSDVSPATAGWSFVAVSYDQSAGSMTLFVDGRSWTSATSFGASASFFDIGHSPSFGEFFEGQIDNVFVFDGALSPAEVAAVRTHGFVGPSAATRSSGLPGASLSYVVPAAGEYVARVVGDGSAAAYVLRSAGSTFAPASVPFGVVSSVPDSGAALAAHPGTYRVTFDREILLSSVVPGDLVVGGVAATAVAAIDGRTLEFTLGAGAGDGTYGVSIAAGAITALDGTASDAFDATFTVDSVVPATLSVSLERDTGPSATDRITNHAALVVTGAESGAMVEYSTNGGSVWNTTFAFVSGRNSVLVRQVDLAGNASKAALIEFTLDNAAPAAPKVTLTSDTGASATDRITKPTAAIFSDGFDTASTINGHSFVGKGGTIGPWTVENGSVDHIGTYWQSAQGNGSIDMTGSSPGTIAATAATVTGRWYVLSFALAGNPEAGNAVKSIRVQVGDVDRVVSFDTRGRTFSNMGWTTVRVPFRATDGGTIRFISLEDGLCGPVLDAVKVTPATLQVDDVEAAAAVSYSTDGGTTWSELLMPVEGANSVLVRQSDMAGNASPVAKIDFTIDSTPPNAPVVTLAVDGGSSATDRVTNDGTLALSGVEQGGVVEYSVDGGTNWSTSFAASSGHNSVLVRQIDVAGNPSDDRPAVITAPSLLGLYRFDDAVNLGRNTAGGPDAVNYGAGHAASGYQGGAASFGGNGFLRALIDVGVGALPRLTWGAWVKPSATNPYRSVISSDDGGYDREIILDDRGGSTSWSTYTGQGVLGSGVVPDSNGWVFLAAVYDQAQATVTFWVGDHAVTSATSFGSSSAFFDIGHNPAFGCFFAGLIDNVFVYGDALTSSQIGDIRAYGFPGSDSSGPGIPASRIEFTLDTDPPAAPAVSLK